MMKKKYLLKTTVMASVYDHNTQLVGPGGSRVPFSLLLDPLKNNADYTARICMYLKLGSLLFITSAALGCSLVVPKMMLLCYLFLLGYLLFLKCVYR